MLPRASVFDRITYHHIFHIFLLGDEIGRNEWTIWLGNNISRISNIEQVYLNFSLHFEIVLALNFNEAVWIWFVSNEFTI